MTRSVLIKVSGKIINPENAGLIRRYAHMITNLVEQEGYKVAVVVGGGPYARKYIDAMRSLGLSEAEADLLGIEVSRLNALLLALMLKDLTYVPIPRSIDEVLSVWRTKKVLVMGGLQPGQSTAGTAAVVAETLGIKTILYASDVDGIYDRDPKIYPDAKKFDIISLDKLEEVIRQEFKAGGYELLDPVAIKVIRRGRIEVVVFNGYDPLNILRILRGEPIGTRIVPSTT